MIDMRKVESGGCNGDLYNERIVFSLQGVLCSPLFEGLEYKEMHALVDKVMATIGRG